MNNYLSKLLFLFFAFITTISAQEVITGTVSEKNDKGIHPLVGVNVFWVGTQSGTITDSYGKFSLPLIKESKKLIISMMGYKADTIEVTQAQNLDIVLSFQTLTTGEVVVTGDVKSTYVDFSDVQNKSVMTGKELLKAACCNLSESFETNPSIDVSFSDAITGVKQIEMLGLSGIYTQTTLENLPYIRGLMSTVGLTYVPGTWVEAINVSKGIGSVANGYESITGQIDISLQKPVSLTGDNLLVNIYGDIDQRFEGNLNYRFSLNENISAITFLHSSTRRYTFDENSDHFTDMPKFSTYNVMQRWAMHLGNGWEGMYGFQYVNDTKSGGTLSERAINNYQYSNGNNHFNIYGKTGYVFADNTYKSFGFQWSLSNYNNKAQYGLRNYKGNEKTGYFNFIYQSIIGSEEHKFRTGMSFVFDQFKETFLTNSYSRIEKVPGAFFEYTFAPFEEFSVITGVRADKHNYYGLMLTPRIHFRYSPDESWVFRGVAGKGYRTSNIFTEFPSAFASSREVNIDAVENFGYGLKQEQAWNYGFNFMHYFYYEYREGTISVDLYRTNFIQSTIGDLDSNPQQINFSSVNNGAYSNSLQVELNMQPLENFDTRIAYRYMDVKQKIAGKMLERSFSSKNRALINLAYSTEKENVEDAQMVYDLTVQWFDKKRIPSTLSNPVEFRAKEYSPAFFLVNTQITRKFSMNFDVYLGIENLLDFRQKDIILDPFNPNSQYFDASLIWGPTNGRMVYAGFRFKM